MAIDLALLILFPAAMAFAGSMDLFTMTIPNRVSLGLALGFFCLAPFVGLGWEAVGTHVLTALAMLAIGIAFYARGWIGGGDAKFFAATALWLGYEHLLEYALLAAFLGGLLTAAFLAVRMVQLPVGLAHIGWIVRLHNANQGVPYGIALAAAGLLVYPNTAWVSALAG